MEDLNEHEESAMTQYAILRQIGRDLTRRATRSIQVNNDELSSMNVLLSAPLEIDEQSPSGSEQRFFVPSYHNEHLGHAVPAGPFDFVKGLVATGRSWEGVWADTYDEGDPDDSDYLPPPPDRLPDFRSWWFLRSLEDMQQAYLDVVEDHAPYELQQSRTDGWRAAFPVNTGIFRYRMPEREEVDWDYRPVHEMQPRDRAKPHFSVVMGDSKVAGGTDEILVSELHAAVEFSKRQLTCGDFTNHHTKPIIIYTLMSETNARITQAYFDAKTNKLVVRQSRILDLRGEKPTPDAYLLLRWMMNTPVGETEYKQDDEGHEIDGGDKQRTVPPTPNLVTTKAG